MQVHPHLKPDFIHTQSAPTHHLTVGPHGYIQQLLKKHRIYRAYLLAAGHAQTLSLSAKREKLIVILQRPCFHFCLLIREIFEQCQIPAATHLLFHILTQVCRGTRSRHVSL